jgi:hypothetical protein
MERKLMCSTVVKQDTASRDISRSSRSSNNNSEPIILHSTVDSTGSKKEMKMSTSTVVKKVTASREGCRRSRSSNIKLETVTKRSTVVKLKSSAAKNEIMGTMRGFQHIYKSNKTTSSQKVREAYDASLKKGNQRSKMAAKREYKKKSKIEEMTLVRASPVHCICPFVLKSETQIFFSGTREKILKNLKQSLKVRVLSAIEDLRVVDTVTGARLESESGDTVFTLIPRQCAIEKLTHVQKTLRSLHALENSITKAEMRGKTRVTVAEDDGKYVTVGLKPNRGRKGISESWPKKLSDVDKQKICNLMSICQDVAKGYVQTNELRGLQYAKMMALWPNLKGVSSQQIWGSLACGKNYYLNSHFDEDFFYSLTTIASEWGLRNDIDRYRMEAEVCNYFTFAEQGIAVALRPGDMLLFNPLYQHCLSSRTSGYETKDVFCLSLYLKTAVVGGNDNSVRI